MTPTLQQEDTARIKRDELLRLLNVTSPVGYQAITARTRLEEIQAELARTAPEQPAPAREAVAEVVAEIVSRPAVGDPPPADFAPATKRKYPRPFSQVAAMLPSVSVSRPPRATPPPLPRPKSSPPVHSLAVPQPAASHTISDVRARLERGEDLSQEPCLSARVASHLTAEEIAMLPMDLRLRLPDVTAWQAPPRIELTPMPGLPCVDLHPIPTDAAAEVTEPDRAVPVESQVVTIAFGIAFVLLCICGIYAAL